MARKSGRIFRGGRQVRETRWLDIDPIQTGLGAASTAAVTHSLNAVELALRPFTVVRTRGNLHLISDQVSASELQSVAFGIAVVSEQAAAIGVTAVPTPETDRSSDLWFVYEGMTNFYDFRTAAGFDSQGGLSRDYDSKAMRKVQDGEDIVVVIETSSISLGASFLVSGRMLVKLH